MNPVRRPHSGSDHDGILAERGRPVMVVRRHPESGAPVPGYLTWGLIPRDADRRPDIQPMNARAETIADKPIFRDAYPFHDRAATVTTCGRICFNRQKINLSQVFAGQTVGIKQTDERIWLVSFMDYDLGYFDDETCRLEPLANPFGPKVLPMSPV